MDDLAKWVIDQMVRVYVAAENRNDFFLLHAVTSSWALRQLLKISGIGEADAVEAIVQLLCCVMSFYIVQRRPEMRPEQLQEQGKS